ncbi:carbohydrate porin [Acetobacter orleanensis]|uniref:carbohydrate porin n=2 Tax=Acetobacter orleanensis TaxID=104099 RepID=UPI0009E372F8|nr:carbohydrate porin [Acetobacter orleanensis]PCD78617.1 porin [Acetobacter orleanensis]
MQRIIKILCVWCFVSGAWDLLPVRANANPPITSDYVPPSPEKGPVPAAPGANGTGRMDQKPPFFHPESGTDLGSHINMDGNFLTAPNTASSKILPSLPLATIEPAPRHTEFFDALLARFKRNGFTFRAFLIDNFVSNVSGGVKPGTRLQNGLGIVESDIDLEKLMGWTGAQIHFGEDFFFLRNNDKHWSPQVGDNTLGYQPPHLFRGNYLSKLTLEQKLFHDKLDVEAGRANLSRYFLIPNCNQILTCFKDIWSQDAGISTFVYATWSGRIAYHMSKSWYVQAAATEVNNTIFFQNGWNWNTNTASGAAGIGEIAYQRGFDQTAYPSTYEFLGYYNSSAKTTSERVTTSSGSSWKAAQHTGGMSGIFFSGQQYIWRKDHGTTRNPHSMALGIYGGAGTDFQSYAPIKAEAYLGAFVQAPFKSHPLDTYGIQLHWTKLGPLQTRFLADANKASGGDGRPPSAAHLVADIHARVSLLPNVALEPSVQYAINPNTYYAPMTAKHPHDIVEVGATLFIYLDKIMGFPP